jgi:hypothetical protein
MTDTNTSNTATTNVSDLLLQYAKAAELAATLPGVGLTIDSNLVVGAGQVPTVAVPLAAVQDTVSVSYMGTDYRIDASEVKTLSDVKAVLENQYNLSVNDLQWTVVSVEGTLTDDSFVTAGQTILAAQRQASLG